MLTSTMKCILLLCIISGPLPPIQDLQFEIQRERNHSLLKLSWNVPLVNGNIIDYYIFVVNQRNRNLTSPAVNVTLPHNGSTVVIALNAINCLGNGPVTTMSMKIGIVCDMFLSLFIVSHMSQLNQVWILKLF